MMLMLAVFSLGAYAQTQQGQSAVGFNIGYGFDSKNATLGVDYRYCITDAVRLSPSLTYFVKNDNHSTWAIDLNAHYVVKLSEMFGFYPLAGLSLSFWNWDAGHGLSHNETRLGANRCSPLPVQAFPLFLHSFTGSYTHTRTYTHTRIINVRIHVCGCV